MAKAAVLPVPVWAQPKRSLPLSKTGIAFSWIGVGSVYPSAFRARRMGSIRFKSSNDIVIVLNKGCKN